MKERKLKQSMIFFSLFDSTSPSIPVISDFLQDHKIGHIHLSQPLAWNLFLLITHIQYGHCAWYSCHLWQVFSKSFSLQTSLLRWTWHTSWFCFAIQVCFAIQAWMLVQDHQNYTSQRTYTDEEQCWKATLTQGTEWQVSQHRTKSLTSHAAASPNYCRWFS